MSVDDRNGAPATLQHQRTVSLTQVEADEN